MKLFIFVLAFVAAAMADLSPEELLYKANGEFTYKMMDEVVKINPGKSVVQSAFSVLTPLSQLALATEGESHNELLRAVGQPDDEGIKSAFLPLNAKLRDIKGVDLKMANRIYVMAGKRLNQNTAATLRETFGSDVKDVDFAQSSLAAKEINDWVEDHTNHRIKDLVSPDSLDADTRSVLVNAIYFKGNWKEKFDARFTTERDFHVDSNTTIKLPFMYKKDDYKYYESQELDAKFLEMPYEGDETSFLIALPNKIDGLDNLLKALTPETLNRTTNNMHTHEVNVRIPKFKIETTTNLKDVLSNIGVKEIFNPFNAKINKLVDGENNLYVSEAIQKAFIEVNEDGAEAAAANEFVAYKRMGRIKPELQFVADRPFYFILKQRSLTLFDGLFLS